MNLIDLHCDTPYVLYNKNQHLDENTGHISLEKAKCLNHYAQVMAFYTSKKHNDETGFSLFHKRADYLNDELHNLRAQVAPCTNAAMIKDAWENHKTAVLFAVEDARILAGNLERLTILYARGVRFLTLVWGGTSCIGGAHDTHEGLTEFGKQVVKKCFELGIVPDLSHASDAVMDEVFRMAMDAGKPVMATHSNSRAIRHHMRNLTDAQFKTIKELGGIVGISYCTSHLTDTSKNTADLSTILAHMDHYLELGGHDVVALGGDFDGIETTPEGLDDLAHILALESAMHEHGYSDELIEKITYKNALQFFEKALS